MTGAFIVTLSAWIIWASRASDAMLAAPYLGWWVLPLFLLLFVLAPIGFSILSRKFTASSRLEARQEATELHELIAPGQSSIERRIAHEIAAINAKLPVKDAQLTVEEIRTAVRESFAEMQTTSPDAATLNREAHGRALAQVYGQAIVQARHSFTLSLIFASAGALILFLGIGLAILRTATGGDQFPSLVTSGAGLVTNLTGMLFIAQANRSRHHLERMALQLRADVRQDERVAAALAVIETVEDAPRKDGLRAEAVTYLLGETSTVLKPPPPVIEPNGSRPRASATL
jgi:hypothetical protein